ncbi:hypothetical protein LOC54_06265 [Acetobacter sp. AN02]|nr:LptA/OstA family protein [Acetobacter sp. AN02]MDG6094714.1 hypothetical protein [Acetobacter sp. AN02]
MAQSIDLSHGGQITVTAAGGFDWDQNAKKVTAYNRAQAVRGNVTVTADRLIAYYRKKPGDTSQPQQDPAPPPGQTGAPGEDSGSNEIYRLEAIGHVHIFTATDQAWGDKGVYDIDKAVLVLTGKALKLTTPQDVLTSRDSMEYYSDQHVSIARGNAVVTTNDGRQIKADVLVGYNAPSSPPAPGQPQDTKKSGGDSLSSGSGKLEKVNAFGHVWVRTATEVVTGDRGVYVPDTGIARIVGNVHITRGPNQLQGNAAIINMHTGLATMTEAPGGRVNGLLVPGSGQDSSDQAAPRPGGKK